MTVIAFLFTTGCYGQSVGRQRTASRSDIFIDIGSIIYENAASMSIGHQFNARWSAYSCIYIPISIKPVDTESEEYIHRTESDSGYGNVSATAPRHNSIEAGIRFWPDKVYQGCYLSLGYLHELPAKPACTVSAGLHIPVWKEFTAEIAYVKTIYNTNMMSDKLKIGVGYVF